MAAAFQGLSIVNSLQNISKKRRKVPDLIKPKVPASILIEMQHAKIIKTGALSFDRSITRILCSYVEHGHMDAALLVFEKITNPDTFSWNVVIKGFVDNGCYREAFEFYELMFSAGVPPDKFTFPFVIKSCVGLLLFTEGCKIHCRLIKIGLDSDVFVCNSLISMYAKNGCIEFAEKVFDEMPTRDSVSWNSMIGGYASVGNGWKTLQCFREMLACGIPPKRPSIIGALTGCALEKLLMQGMEIHCHVIRQRFGSNQMVQTTLTNMYSKCGNVSYAEHVFSRMSQRNVVAWNAMIGGYATNSRPDEALSCVIEMQKADGISPDIVTMVNLLPSCTQLRCLLQGKSIHGTTIRRGLLPFFVLETALFDMYAKCGELRSAELLFKQMTQKNLISYNAMIAAYVQNGQIRNAVALFHEMQKGSLEPDSVTIASIIPAYSELAFLCQGKEIHAYAIKAGCGSNTFILNSLIYMYAKCGDLKTAQRIFDSMSADVVSWNTIIMGYAIHGFGKTAIELFSKMQEKGINPNKSTFVSLLSACSISGMVDEGWKYFNSMTTDYKIEPEIEHYGCMVDLLGRTGDHDRAQSFIEEMPLVPTARIWGSLLRASRNAKDIEFAENVVECILTLGHDLTGCYVLLSNMYAKAKRWDDVDRVRLLMKEKGLERTKACSVLELHNRTCSFFNSDTSDVEANTVFDVLYLLLQKIGEGIYIPDIKFKPQDVVKRKASLPSSHSVRLALCFGLISTTVGTPVLIKKNVRICGDCHHAVKLISRVTGREIVVGDSRIYHHFRNGNCCCGDYW